MSGIESTKYSGAIAPAMPMAPQRTRTAGPAPEATTPETTPARRLPKAHRASSPPAYPRCPCSSAKATVVTSAAPNRMPSARQTTARGTTVRHGIG